MSTRSKIGIERADGTIEGIYCHHDGYFSGVGSTLLKHYQDRQKVEQLIALGDLSTLAEEIGEKHDFNRSYPDGSAECTWCLAYGRDRGEPDTEAVRYRNRRDFMRNGEEYAYLYTLEDTWVACKDPDGATRLTRLTEKRIKND